MTRRKSATCACYLRLPSCRSPSARTRTGKLGRRFGTMSSAIYAYALDGQIVSAGCPTMELSAVLTREGAACPAGGWGRKELKAQPSSATRGKRPQQRG